jgi:RNA recognition motif-containing protein
MLLFQAFQMHGEIEEGAVIYDKATGKSRGYGFITYKHMESAQSALGAPSRLIDVSWLFLSSCLHDLCASFCAQSRPASMGDLFVRA